MTDIKYCQKGLDKMNKSEWGFFIAGSIGLAMMLIVGLAAALA